MSGGRFIHSVSGTETAGKLPINEQEQQIYQFVMKNGSITASQTAAVK